MGYGFNIGLLYDLNKDTRAGIAYRSRIKHDIDGSVDFANAPAGITGGWFSDCDAKAKLTMLDSLSLSLCNNFTPNLTIMGDITWTNWSAFDELAFEFANGQPNGITTEQWKGNYRYALGLTYLLSGQWSLRVGMAYDETPIPDSQHRTPRVPCDNRLWMAAGFGHKISGNFTMDVAFYRRFKDR